MERPLYSDWSRIKLLDNWNEKLFSAFSGSAVLLGQSKFYSDSALSSFASTIRILIKLQNHLYASVVVYVRNLIKFIWILGFKWKYEIRVDVFDSRRMVNDFITTTQLLSFSKLLYLEVSRFRMENSNCYTFCGKRVRLVHSLWEALTFHINLW